MNEVFLKRMKGLLQEDYEKYLETLAKKPYRGFRVNTKKISEEDFFNLFKIPSHRSKFAMHSYVLDSDDGYGNSLPHALGLMYMQEPSAASAVEVLNPRPMDWVLDLCAAPGGKSTQIAQYLDSEGLLITNEIETKRAQILLSNIERLGISNAIVTNSTPEKLSFVLQGMMDKVLVDAPCSGEGMFKKESKALEDWSEEHVKSCAKRQRSILPHAIKMLKDDGILVYSTCTYAVEENEENVAWMLEEFKELELLNIDVTWGRKGLHLDGFPTEYTRRILPMDEGEGHFVAKFRKKGITKENKLTILKSELLPDCVKQFIKSELKGDYNYFCKNNRVYAGSHPFYDLKDNYVLRNQVLIGEVVNNRFEPHQHLYTSTLFTNNINHEIICEENEIESFRKGNILSIPTTKGYVGIKIYNNYIGFGKSDGSIIKNKVPKGLRLR
ncbi:NOL1/NOP2/sun family putative RNA methylase [Anaerorhabdus sp.]|jgi:NOL1/NOP2/sun family putative RNA methylase|uniref:NOL1/NOP2/sun family putative RNA methylase n=1 Tax=Anaerorhabdus sp. TaxID=1872524 RepID=UPI002FCBECDD